MKQSTFTERFEQLIEYVGVTSYKLAKEISTSEAVLSNIKAGKSKPSFDFLEKLLNKYEAINANWLIIGKGNMLNDSALAKTSPNSKEKEDVKKVEGNTEDVISLLNEIKSEQKRGFASLQNILSIRPLVQEKSLDELPHDELVKRAEKRKAELQSGKADLKNQPLKQKEHK